MEHADILIVNALRMELDALTGVLSSIGVTLESSGKESACPYLTGTLAAKEKLTLALARPTRMGSTPVATIASSLVARLQPRCLAMSGVCAGNPADVALGDVVVAEIAYAYDEGKRVQSGFEGDHRQIPQNDRWLRHIQEFDVSGLSTFGPATEEDGRIWLLEHLAANKDPASHPARQRYLGGGRWTKVVRTLEREGLIKREQRRFTITKKGLATVDAWHAYDSEPITKLPFSVHVGPMASGNAVVKDGLTWDMLKIMGVRTAISLEMEAAAIAQVAHRLGVPHWIVAKGVMDYADPKKDDRVKPFAARASAEVLIRLLQTLPFETLSTETRGPEKNMTNVVGDVIGSNITIHQNVSSRAR